MRIRNKEIVVRLTDEEYKILKDKCEFAKINMSYYIRKLIIDGKIVVDNSKIENIQMMAQLSNDLNDFEFQIKKIGNNVNQLLQVIHENNDLYSEEEINEAKCLFESSGNTFDELIKVIYERLFI